MIVPSLLLARCHFPVRGLGFGARTGIWLQGCSIRCPGCIVPETWEAREDEHRVALAPLLAAVQPWVEASDGVTISGGEPFDHPDGLLALLAALRALRPDADLLVYSGYPWRKLEREHADVLAYCDVVVSEPFRMAGAHAATALAGAGNQQVHLLTALARERYRGWRAFSAAASVAVDGAAVRMAGIGAVQRLGERSRRHPAGGMGGSPHAWRALNAPRPAAR